MKTEKNNGKTDKEQLTEIVERIYREKQVVAEPLRDRILVRLLPKSHATAGRLIVTPDVQNKVVAEAVVLAAFKPYWKHYRSRFEDGRNVEEDVVVSPSVSVGDHVLIPHWVGAPVDPLDAGVGEFRVVKDEEIMMRIDYERRDAVRDGLIGILVDSDLAEPILAPAVADKLLERYHVIRKDLSPLTLSGA